MLIMGGVLIPPHPESWLSVVPAGSFFWRAAATTLTHSSSMSSHQVIIDPLYFVPLPPTPSPLPRYLLRLVRPPCVAA